MKQYEEKILIYFAISPSPSFNDKKAKNGARSVVNPYVNTMANAVTVS